MQPPPPFPIPYGVYTQTFPPDLAGLAGTQLPPQFSLPPQNNAFPGAGPFAYQQQPPPSVFPTQTNYNPAQTNFNPNYSPAQTNYNPAQTNYSPAQTNYSPAQTNYNPAQTNYNPAQTNCNPAQTNYNPSAYSTNSPNPGLYGAQASGSMSQPAWGQTTQPQAYSSTTPPPATNQKPSNPTQLLECVRRAQYTADKVALITQATDITNFVTSDVEELVRSIEYVSDQKAIILALYPRVIDKSSFESVIALLAYTEDREEIKRQLGIAQTPEPTALPPPPTAPIVVDSSHLLDQASHAMKLLQEEKNRIAEQVAQAKREQELLRIQMQQEAEMMRQQAEQQRRQQEHQNQMLANQAAAEKQRLENERRALEEKMKRELGMKDTELLQEKSFMEDQLSAKDLEVKKLQERLRRLENVDETEQARVAMAKRTLVDLPPVSDPPATYSSGADFSTLPGFEDSIDDVINNALRDNRWKDI